MVHDCRNALRIFRRNPVLTLTAIVCLALGIGGTTAVFSVVDGVLLRTLPYADADRLVVLRTVDLENRGDRGRVSEAEVHDWQLTAKSFDAIAGFRWMTIDMVDAERSERLQGLWVTPEYFTVFRLQPSVGKSFDRAGPPGIILGRTLWERRFALDPSVTGKTMPVGICCPQEPQVAKVPILGAVDHDVPFPPTMPGIRDRGHGVNDIVDYWFPVYVDRSPRPGFRNMEVIGKLKAGVTLAQAQTEMDSIARQLEASFPDTNRGWKIRVVPIADEVLSDVRPALYLLMGAAAFVLLIACGNVTVLLTFKAIARFHEVAIRMAIGAGTGRLIRQFITEGVILSLCGGGVGLLVAIGVKRFLIGLAPANLPRLSQISLDGRVLGFALAATLMCGVVVGLIPSLRVLKFDLESTLRSENSRNATSHRRARSYEPLLVLQVALTLVLLIGSGLMIKSLNRLIAVAPGFETTNVLTTTLSLPSAKHAWRYNATFSERVMERIRAIPGVDAAGMIRGIPMSEVPFFDRFFRWEQAVVGNSGQVARIRVVSRDYFRAMRIPMLSGRDFAPQDGIGEIGKTKVIIINEALARLFWPGQNPVNRKVVAGEDFDLRPGNVPMDVIGVVSDVRYTSLDAEPVPEIYYPDGLFPQDEFTAVIRTKSSPRAMTDAVRAAMLEVERDVFIGSFRTMDDVISDSLTARRFTMLIMSVFSTAGLLLAVAGIAGIVTYSLSLRVREIGIRVAMGAGPRQVILLISRQGLAPAFAGLAMGLLLALAVTRLLRHLLYAVSPYDPAVFGSAVAALAVVSALSAGISAYRAGRVDATTLLK